MDVTRCCTVVGARVMVSSGFEFNRPGRSVMSFRAFSKHSLIYVSNKVANDYTKNNPGIEVLWSNPAFSFFSRYATHFYWTYLSMLLQNYFQGSLVSDKLLGLTSFHMYV